MIPKEWKEWKEWIMTLRSNKPRYHRVLLFLGFIPVLLVLGVARCTHLLPTTGQTTEDPTHEETQKTESWMAQSFVVQGFEPSNSVDSEFVRIDEISCHEDARESIWYFPFQTIVTGRTWVTLHIPSTPNDTNVVRVEVEGIRYPISVSEGDLTFAKALPDLCKAHKEDRTNGVRAPTPHLEDGLMALMKQVIPDCEFSLVSGEPTRCSLPMASKQVVLQDINHRMNHMIQKWQRLPYLLSRRMALVMQLIEIAGGTQPLEGYCTILQNSSPNELPLSFRSTPWRTKLCDKTLLQGRSEVAMIGIHGAMAELEFLFKLGDRTNQSGHLEWKRAGSHISSTQVTSLENQETKETIWVELRPEADVYANINETAHELRAESSPQESLGCWHPLFGQDKELLMVTGYLGVGKGMYSQSCELPSFNAPQKSEIMVDPLEYAMASIVGETSFAIERGQTLKLHLPMGTYHYTVKHDPMMPESLSKSAHKPDEQVGDLSWKLPNGHKGQIRVSF